MKRRIFPLFIVFLAIPGQDLWAQDVQWRGPNRDGIYTDTMLLKEWPEDGPEMLFVSQGLGRGYSSAVATDKQIFVTGINEDQEYLTAMDLQGRILWQKPYGPAWDQSIPETRSTPTVEDDRVYILTGKDNMACLHANTGALIWSVDIHEKYYSRWDMFGVSESVLLVGDKIITSPAGDSTQMIALDKMTGELIWKSKSIGANRSNMSPILIHHCGKPYVIASTQTHMIGVDPENGEILWDYHYNFLNEKNENTTILANTPLYKDSCLWISNGWEVPSVMLEIAPDGRSVSEKFKDRTFDNQNMGVVLVDGFMYGSNFTGRNTGKWVCMNWHTGEIKWVSDFHNKGPIIYADGMLYILEEKRGNMALVRPDPEVFEIVSSFRISEGAGPFWARPTIYNQMLLVRHGDVLIAYDIKL